MGDFILFLIIVLSVLQTILFFKLWGMANNIKKIKDKIIPPLPPISTIRREIKKKNPDIANLLFNVMWDDLEAVWEKRNGYVANYPAHIEYFKKLYEQAGVSFPEDVQKIKCDADYEIYSLKRN